VLHRPKGKADGPHADEQQGDGRNRQHDLEFESAKQRVLLEYTLFRPFLHLVDAYGVSKYTIIVLSAPRFGVLVRHIGLSNATAKQVEEGRLGVPRRSNTGA
jgi:hypothetical protein